MRTQARWVLGSGALIVVLALVAAFVWWRTGGAGVSHELTAVGDVDELTAAISRTVQPAMRDAHVPGVAVAVVHGRRPVWSGSFGTAPATVFQAGSISKTIAASAVLALAEDGVVDLDAPVSRYLTSWRLPAGSPDPDRVTLRRLLSHTAGIDTPGYLGVPADQPLPSTAQSLAGAATGGVPVRQAERAGSYAYSGGGFTIAQQVVEDVTREPFAAVVQREVLTPLGMAASGYDCTTSASPGPRDAGGHLASGAAAPRYRYAEAAAAGLCTTAGDLARFAVWLGSSDPRAVTMRRPAGGTGGRYGLGTELMGGGTAGHPGVNRGFHAELLADPDAGAALVVLTDGDRGKDVLDAVLHAWHDSA